MLCLFCPGITKAKSISISCIFVICYNDFWHTIPDYINLLSYWSLQVVKPVNLEAMSKWVGSIPDDVVEDMANIAPMLAKMGYDPNGNPPKYGDPDPEVLRNTNDVKEHNDVWEAKGEMVKSLSKKNEGKWMREKCFRRTEDLIQIFSETKKKSDCDCTLKPLKDFSVLINWLSFFHPFKLQNLVIQQLNYSL